MLFRSRYAGNDPTNAVDPFGTQPRTTKELEALRKAGRRMTATKSLEQPLTGAELLELKNLLEAARNMKLTRLADYLRLEELQIQFQNAGAAISGAADLEVLKKIIGAAGSICPGGTLQGKTLKKALEFYEKGIGVAIKGIKKIDEELYNRYVEARIRAPHEEILLPGFHNEETSERYRLRYELAKLQRELAASRAAASADEDEWDEEDEWEEFEWDDDF